MHQDCAVTDRVEVLVHAKAGRFPDCVLQVALAMLLLTSVSAQTLTLTHFPNPSDFPILSNLGYDAAVITLNPNRPSNWEPTLDAAAAAGIKLIAGGYPAPYQFNNGTWTITGAGMTLLKFLESRPDVVLALYVFNEPYYTNPYTSQATPCGYFSADDLRALRSAIQSVWPGAKIYHDLGNPAEWAPGGTYARRTPCVGDKYADQTGIADYVGVWEYPFTTTRADTASAFNALSAIVNFVTSSMQPALPISLNQTFACATCSPSLVFPTAQQMLSWNCATRVLPVAGVDWYTWRAFIPTYSEALADHPAAWPLTTAAACGTGMGSDLIGVSAASGLPFAAPGSIVSVFGANLTAAAATAAIPPLPTSVAGMTLQIRDANGSHLNAPLAFVSAGQINFVMPSNVAVGQAALSWASGARSVALGTVLIRNVAPALFSADGSGAGAAAGTAVRVSASNQQSFAPLFQCSGTVCSPAPIDLSERGSVYLTVYGTGIRNYTRTVTCSINGLDVPIASTGPQGYYEGLDQVNIGPLPNLSGAGAVPLMLTVDGVSSNAVQVNFP